MRAVVSGETDFKDASRIVDPLATRKTLLKYPTCIACGRRASNGHHVISVGRGKTGDDVVEGILSLCGTGAQGCHGALHGSPEVVGNERHDAEWVARRIGERLDRDRPDVVAYVLGKMGVVAGLDFLRRKFFYNSEET